MATRARTFAPEFQNEAERFAAATAPAWGKFLLRTAGWSIYIGREQREGMSVAQPFYFWWCAACARFTNGYPAGFRGEERLNCANCGARHPIAPPWKAVGRFAILAAFLAWMFSG